MDSNTREKGIIPGGMPPPVPHRRLQTIRITERKGCVVLFKKAEQKRLVRREIQGGKGEAHCLYAISKGEGPEKSRFKMAATMTLDPGASIGIHTHETDEEIYVILSGKGMYTDDDGSRSEVGPGDITLTMRGQKHGLEVSNDGPLTLLAFIAE
ncbi:cupin domain-containing protein [Fretibacterium sp. OH1220_COT-178]|nr:cupin domain-containing protein [Fretibacterium sp. OH1220_COT-178]